VKAAVVFPPFNEKESQHVLFSRLAGGEYRFGGGKITQEVGGGMYSA
jgi:hypothetical protein